MQRTGKVDSTIGEQERNGQVIKQRCQRPSSWAWQPVLLLMGSYQGFEGGRAMISFLFWYELRVV